MRFDPPTHIPRRRCRRPVRDHAPRAWRFNGEDRCRLVARMIDNGQPEARPLRPVIRERDAPPTCVESYDQAVLRRAVVPNDDVEHGFMSRLQRNADHPAVVCESPAWFMGGPKYQHRINGHPDEVEREHAVFGDAPLEIQACVAADRAPRVGNRNGEQVILHIDPTALRRRRQRQEQRREEATDRSHTPHPTRSPPSPSSPGSRSPLQPPSPRAPPPQLPPRITAWPSRPLPSGTPHTPQSDRAYPTP